MTSHSIFEALSNGLVLPLKSLLLKCFVIPGIEIPRCYAPFMWCALFKIVIGCHKRSPKPWSKLIPGK